MRARCSLWNGNRYPRMDCLQLILGAFCGSVSLQSRVGSLDNPQNMNSNGQKQMTEEPRNEKVRCSISRADGLLETLRKSRPR